jgi:hypothetical protein
MAIVRAYADTYTPPPREVLKVTLSGNQAVPGSDAPVVVDFDNVVFNTFPGSAWDNATATFSAVTAGYYEVTAEIIFDDIQSDADQLQVYMMTTGPGGATSVGAGGGDCVQIDQFDIDATSVGLHTMNVTSILYLDVADETHIRVRQVGGAAQAEVQGVVSFQSGITITLL